MRRALALLALVLAGCGDAPRPVAAGGPSGLLFLAGRDPGTLIRVDTAAGSVSTRTGLRQLGGGDPPYMVAFTGGRVITFALGRTSSFAPDVSAPKRLGEAWFFVPSATPGRVWNILLRPGTNVEFRGVREVTVGGHVTAQHRGHVPGWPVGAVTDGIVVERRHLEVWDPATGRIVRRLPGTFPVAFRGSLVASCADPCRALHLGDQAIRGPFMPFPGAFSPDGRWLALPATGRRLAIVDVAAGTVSLVAGARLDAVYQRVAWASSGWLFYNTGRARIGAWRPGRPARLLGLKVGKFVDMAAD